MLQQCKILEIFIVRSSYSQQDVRQISALYVWLTTIVETFNLWNRNLQLMGELNFTTVVETIWVFLFG